MPLGDYPADSWTFRAGVAPKVDFPTGVWTQADVFTPEFTDNALVGNTTDQAQDKVGWYSYQDGMRVLSGTLRLNSGVLSTSARVAFQVPANLAPPSTIGFAVTNDTNNSPAMVLINGLGNVEVYGTGTPLRISLGGLCWYPATPPAVLQGGSAPKTIGAILPNVADMRPPAGLMSTQWTPAYTTNASPSGTLNTVFGNPQTGVVLPQLRPFGASGVGFASDAVFLNVNTVEDDWRPYGRLIFPVPILASGTATTILNSRVDVAPAVTLGRAEFRSQFAGGSGDPAYNLYTNKCLWVAPRWQNMPSRAGATLGDRAASTYFWLAADEDWTNLTLTSPWLNYGSGYQVAGVFRDAYGRIYLQGLVKDGTTLQTICTLPVGWRPSVEEVFSVQTSSGIGAVKVLTNGNVVAFARGGYTGGVGTWVSLSGIVMSVN